MDKSYVIKVYKEDKFVGYFTGNIDIKYQATSYGVYVNFYIADLTEDINKALSTSHESALSISRDCDNITKYNYRFHVAEKG